MRFNSGYGSYGLWSPAGMSPAIKTLLITNIGLFILINFFRGFPWLFVFGLVPADVFGKWMLWQPVTYLFIHNGLWHLVLNMLMLWMFGSVLEQTWGTRQFLFYYFLTGISAGICSIVFAWGSPLPVVGASGAIFGLLAAFAVLFPETITLIFFIFPMKMKHAVLVLAGINLLGALSSQGSEIAYVAHLGGGLVGYLYLRQEWLRFRMAGMLVPAAKPKIKTTPKVVRPEAPADLDAEVDKILDKISQQGMASLTEREKEVLVRKSKMK